MTAHKGATFWPECIKKTRFAGQVQLVRLGKRKKEKLDYGGGVLSCLFLFCLLSKVAVTLSLFRAGLQSKYVLIMKKVQEKHHDKRKRKLPALVLRPLSGNTQTYQQTSSRKNKYFFTLT